MQNAAQTPERNEVVVRTRPHCMAEKTYALGILLGELLGISHRIEWAADAPLGYTLHTPSGGTLLIEDHFFEKIPDGDWLRVVAVPDTAATYPSPFDDTPVSLIFGQKKPFFSQKSPTHAVLHTDVVAAAFFMVTRWEEYVRPERDRYGRFPATASLAHRAGFLGRPVVHEWAELLRHAFRQVGWSAATRPARQYRVVLSCDVDHPRLWWRGIEKIKTLAGALMRPRTAQAWHFWWKNHLWAQRDPFDTFDRMLDGYDSVQFNFLGDRPRHFDCWYDLRHPFVGRLMERIAVHPGGHRIGFHPSREAHDDAARFDHELASLRAVSPLPVETGRHHYLCFEAPRTWRRWAEAGLKVDSTLGYSECEGFRAGMCVPFEVFDVEARQPLPLREQPLVVMDVTLAEYRRLSPKAAQARVAELAAQVERHHGELTVLWHNSSLHTPEWAAYDAAVFQEINEL
jgi:hypothetical protein